MLENKSDFAGLSNRNIAPPSPVLVSSVVIVTTPGDNLRGLHSKLMNFARLSQVTIVARWCVLPTHPIYEDEWGLRFFRELSTEVSFTLSTSPYALLRAFHSSRQKCILKSVLLIWIRFWTPGSWSFRHQAKLVRKTLISTIFWLLYDFNLWRVM